jgi:hypothetical protein
VKDETTLDADDIFSEIAHYLPSPLRSLQEVQEVPNEEVVDESVEIIDEHSSQLETTREETLASKFKMLCSLFPKADPNRLYEAVEMLPDEEAFSDWVSNHVETNGRHLEPRDTYDKNAQVTHTERKHLKYNSLLM